MYGAPELNHYIVDSAQMARFYGLPCYSTAAVADTSVPGIQATVEKLITLMRVPQAGPQYIHYAFGLLERTNVFCPEQAIMDDAHIGIVKYMLRDTTVCQKKRDAILTSIRSAMGTDHKTYMYELPLPTREQVYVRYPLEDSDIGSLYAAHQKYQEIMAKPHNNLPEKLQREIVSKIPGILPQTLRCN
jgi:trimethylamine--corrinoid protein Co-methyltransferase